MRRFIFVLSFLLVAGTLSRAATTVPVEVRFIPCAAKQHLIEADSWSCTASAGMPVIVYGSYEPRLPIYFSHVYLQVPRNVDPPSIKWSEERGLISFSAKDFFNGPAAAVAAPGYQILVPKLDSHREERSGKTTIVAKLNGSIKRTLRVPALVYKTLRVGCSTFSRAPGLIFASNDLSTIAAAPGQSDLYVTGPAPAAGAAGTPSADYGCPAAFADRTGDYVLHFPGGGTTLQTARFDKVAPQAWKNEITSISIQDIKNNTLIFKTKRGAIVKVLLFEIAFGRIGGAYETTTSSGVFGY
ncbi:MAG: hypothetical protein ABR584_02150 [Candidatus Baltobacteraceae bacterium]